MLRLFIDITVLDFLSKLKKRERELLFARFRDICAHPANYRDFCDTDRTGRILDGHIVGRFAITYWEDFADRDLKITEVTWADQKT